MALWSSKDDPTYQLCFFYTHFLIQVNDTAFLPVNAIYMFSTLASSSWGNPTHHPSGSIHSGPPSIPSWIPYNSTCPPTPLNRAILLMPVLWLLYYGPLSLLPRGRWQAPLRQGLYFLTVAFPQGLAQYLVYWRYSVSVEL